MKQHTPKLGLQGPVIAWQDSWANEGLDEIMRTGTGSVYPPQDPTPEPAAFVEMMQQLGAQFYLHHMFPNRAGQSALIRDMAKHGMDICLGNEYGNINGPFVEGTNRFDVPDEVILEAAQSGKLIGLLYDEPEHLQINAGQYRKDDFLPHWGKTDGLTLEQSYEKVVESITQRVSHVHQLLDKAGLAPESLPLISEFVFPTMFHTHARGGMMLCPKVMKESFQSLQLSTAMGAAKQYSKDLWICVDLWGPDVGEWFTRISGLPGHSPEEYMSALKMAYYMGPTHLFTENIDPLLRHEHSGFSRTEFGEVWYEFVKGFIPEHPITWNHQQASSDIVFIHSDDSNYGQNERLFGNRELQAPLSTQSIFHVWHLLSHGTIPSHGSCLHIPGYDFPRHRLKAEVDFEDYPLAKGREWGRERRVHPLFYPVNNVLVYDEFVKEQQLGNPKLIIAAGSRISINTLQAIRKRAEEGATVIVAKWLVPKEWSESKTFGSEGKAIGSEGKGFGPSGTWLVTDDFLSDARVKETALPFLGKEDCWIQRFGSKEVRMYAADEEGFTLDFEVTDRG